jgi:hypothetical protein
MHGHCFHGFPGKTDLNKKKGAHTMQYTTQPQIAMMVRDAGVDSPAVSIQYLLGLIVSTKKAQMA